MQCSTHYFDMKANILADFQIRISVPLKRRSNASQVVGINVKNDQKMMYFHKNKEKMMKF